MPTLLTGAGDQHKPQTPCTQLLTENTNIQRRQGSSERLVIGGGSSSEVDGVNLRLDGGVLGDYNGVLAPSNSAQDGL